MCVPLALALQSSQALAASWASGVEAPLPANAGSTPFVNLRSVSCASAGNCSAVGYYNDSSGHRHGLLLTETAGMWTRGLEPGLPANAGANPDAGLSSVSCASAGNCSAVGSYVDSSLSLHGLLLTENAAETVEFLHPPRADLEKAEVVGADIARLTVRFLAEFRSRTKGPEGEGVDDRRTARDRKH